MDRKNIILKITSLAVTLLILASFAMPVIVQASSLTDSAKKTVLKTVADIEKYIDESKYPGYKEKLIALKKENLNWKFTLYHTGLDWNTVIYNETKGFRLEGAQLDSGDVNCDGKISLTDLSQLLVIYTNIK